MVMVKGCVRLQAFTDWEKLGNDLTTHHPFIHRFSGTAGDSLRKSAISCAKY